MPYRAGCGPWRGPAAARSGAPGARPSPPPRRSAARARRSTRPPSWSTITASGIRSPSGRGIRCSGPTSRRVSAPAADVLLEEDHAGEAAAADHPLEPARRIGPAEARDQALAGELGGRERAGGARSGAGSAGSELAVLERPTAMAGAAGAGDESRPRERHRATCDVAASRRSASGVACAAASRRAPEATPLASASEATRGGAAPARLGEEHLHVADPRLGEPGLAEGQVEAPGAAEALVVAELLEPLGRRLEALRATPAASARSWRRCPRARPSAGRSARRSSAGSTRPRAGSRRGRSPGWRSCASASRSRRRSRRSTIACRKKSPSGASSSRAAAEVGCRTTPSRPPRSSRSRRACRRCRSRSR